MGQAETDAAAGPAPGNANGPDVYRCGADGALVTERSFPDHLGHKLFQPVTLSMKEWLLWNLGLL